MSRVILGGGVLSWSQLSRRALRGAGVRRTPSASEYPKLTMCASLSNLFFFRQGGRAVTLTICVISFSNQVILRVLTRLNSVCIRTANVRVIIIGPSNLRNRLALRRVINIYAGRQRRFTFLNNRFNLLITSNRGLALNIRYRLARLMRVNLLRFLALRATRSNFRARRRLFRKREFNSVIIYAGLRSIRSIFLRILNDRRCSEGFHISVASFLYRLGAILLQRRSVRRARIVAILRRYLRANVTVERGFHVGALYLWVLSRRRTRTLVILTWRCSRFLFRGSCSFVVNGIVVGFIPYPCSLST